MLTQVVPPAAPDDKPREYFARNESEAKGFYELTERLRVRDDEIPGELMVCYVWAYATIMFWITGRIEFDEMIRRLTHINDSAKARLPEQRYAAPQINVGSSN